MTAKDRMTIADKDAAILYCRSFYVPRLNALDNMAYAAQTAGIAFLSKMTEPPQQKFIEEASIAFFMTALDMLPGALPLTKFWKRLDASKPYFADRAQALVAKIPSGVKITAHITSQSSSQVTRTTILQSTLVKIGSKIARGRRAVVDEWDRAEATVIERSQKGQPGLKKFTKNTLGALPAWVDFQKPLTAAFEYQLYKNYVNKLVIVSGAAELGGAQWYSGLNNTQFDYIKKSFKEINKVGDLHTKWGAKYRDASHPGLP